MQGNIMIRNIVSGLNVEQRAAVKFGVGNKLYKLPRPLLILAGAGTGKTKTLAHRVAYLVAKGVNPNRILLLVFGSSAATQMRDRTQTILREAGLKGKGDLDWAGTFHSVGARLVGEFASHVGLRPNFTILNRSDAEGMIKQLAHQLPPHIRKQLPNVADCLKIYSRKVGSCCTLSVLLAQDFPDLLARQHGLQKLFKAYRQAKLTSNVADFDDLLRLWLVLLRDQKIGPRIRRRFEHVLVDEFQDTNRLQAEILRGVKPDGRGLTVVGDDAQSIYSFRGADVQNIRDFGGSFDCASEIIKLEQNYRSNQPILDLCNAVMAGSGDDLGKALWTKRKGKRKPQLRKLLDGYAQAQYVADGIEEAKARGVPFREQAVLFRVADHSAELEVELNERGIPFVKRGGPKFLEQKHVKDVLSILKWMENPRDRIAAVRALGLLPGIGAGKAEPMLDQLGGWLTLKRLGNVAVPTSAQKPWNALSKLLSRRGRLCWPRDLSKVCRWYETVSGGKFERSDLITLRTAASQFGSRREFLTVSVLDAPVAEHGDSDVDRVVLSTVHSAKGLEWECVTIISAVDGYFPSARAEDGPAIEEERRVFYVALSRAKDRLEILAPLRAFAGRCPKGFRQIHVSLKATPFIPTALLPMCRQ
jgi:DNA helicase-2/ATP-dependent DNA helicase PcrA